MDLRTPAAAAVPALRARVLTVLANADAALTGRSVAVLAEGSVAGVAKMLESLVSGGLVHKVDAGSAHLYVLNRAHLAAPAVEMLARMRTELVARMRARIAAFTDPPLSATLFGSAARGEGDDDSDIDLLLVRGPLVEESDEDWADDLDTFASLVLAWTGNPLNAVDYSLREVATPTAARRRLLSRV